ncbi:MAG: arylsulfatase [Phycisphaerae bacterium SG8_4]|nr:MAG: arylsulfatase [Phycisphaerae bacterium SG8_4]
MKNRLLILLALIGTVTMVPNALAQKRPNIVIIWGDDIGQSNISAYTKGMMGYRTPNIDRVANEGMIFTDYYAEQSCTAGRAAFIMGQSVFRSGLSKVGLPGADIGMQKEDPMPTMHGFDEFYGNLYHLNAEEEPELRDYPKDPEFLKRYGPRGVLHSWALPNGRQKIENTGPLTKKRMETVDDDVANRAAKFLENNVKAGKPVFLWVNFTHMHFRTHVKPESEGQSGRWQSPYHDAMIDHDKNVGTVLDKIDQLGIADNTIVLYSTDNGPHYNTWPDAGTTPFRGEKNSNWEGAYRVPAMVRWPGEIKAGSVSNEIMSHMDWLPTLLAAAGVPDVKERLMKGHRAGNMTYKVHLDGYNFLPFLTGRAKKGPREEFFYFSDDGDLQAIRYDNWKIVFAQQRAQGTMLVWGEPLVNTRVPWLYNLRTDPYERATITSNTYWDWWLDHAYLLVPAQGYVGEVLKTFKEFPPRQKAASFTIDEVMEQLNPATH